MAADLHIHSGLSPCANKDMTPNNIIGMAKLKRLDIIAITDHNCTKNLQSFIKVAETQDLICIPGVEITTKEEVHLIALFNNLNASNKFQEILDNTLPKIKNNPKLFGNQYIYDEEDNILEDYHILTMNALDLSLKEAISQVKKIGGICIPAHIDRHSFSILSNLGFIESDLCLNTVEITKNCNYNLLLKKHPYLESYNKIISSDAHELGQILEREFFIDTNNKKIEDILKSINEN
ncbi:PHP domain-containing protein [Natronincola peptidivorans]|nr:PHP domain-containing protein [Natronincola peptidivorans]